MKKQNAFTLVELLVVVGIIALLAAIAAPNYQVAINRSKVARFKADARTSESAIASFYIDYGDFPDADRYSVLSDCSPWDSNPNSAGGGFLLRSLTTPSPYITKLPIDVFRNEGETGECDPYRKTFLYSTDTQNVGIYGSTPDAYYVSWTYAELMGTRTLNEQRPSNAIYMINSPGSDGDRDHGRDAYSSGQSGDPEQYDPTNGAISNGDLFMFGPGLGFGLDQ